MRAGPGASTIGSCHTVPVNQSGGPRRVGASPQRVIFMALPDQASVINDQ
jgi:hypothetical protein